MSDLDRIVRELVIANRILANENIVDAYGHVSHRHPDDPGRYLLARSVAPELVERGDIVEFTLDGLPTREEKRALYLERFIHGAIYEARPDVIAVVHAPDAAVRTDRDTVGATRWLVVKVALAPRFQEPPIAVVEPAVVDAAEASVFDAPVAEIGAPVRAVDAQEAGPGD